MSSIVSIKRSGSGRPRERRPSWPAQQRRSHDGTKTELRKVRAWVFALKLAALAMLAGASAWGIASSGGILKAALQICMGLLIAHATELSHQCLHKTATGRARLDHALGMILGWPSLTSFWGYLYSHFWHHKYNGTVRDKESFDYSYELMESPSRTRRLIGLLRHLSMAGHYRTALKRISLALRGRLAVAMMAADPEMTRSSAGKIQRDYRIMATLLFAAVLVSAVFRTWLVVEIWLIPLLFVWGLAHALIELPEHWGCDRPTADVFANTRSIKSGWFARWLTNNNGNHVGHHHDMNIPMERLPEFERRLMEKHSFRHLEESYPRFYAHFFTAVLTGRRTRQSAHAGADAHSRERSDKGGKYDLG